MVKANYIILLIIFSISGNLQSTFANGGPVDISHFRKTGNIRLLRKADVQLLQEDLNIKVVGDQTIIDVEYKLKNLGPTQDIQYGFPVDAYETTWHYGMPYHPLFEKSNDPVKSFKAYDNSEEIKTYFWIVDSVYEAYTTNLNEGYSNERAYQIHRKWYSTTLLFEAGETKTLRIQYIVENTKRDKSPGFKWIHRYTDRHFTYHLTPSGKWGDGIVKDFSLTIDVQYLDSILAEYSVDGIEGLTKTGSVYTLQSEEYDLKRSDRIHIHYNRDHLLMKRFIERYAAPKRVISGIKTSSTTKDITPLIDGSPITTWTAKKGDWIEIALDSITTDDNQIFQVTGILILNGDYSSEHMFNHSGKISTVKVIINDTIVFNTEPWKQEKGEKEIDLPIPIYKAVGSTLIKGFANILADGEALYLQVAKNLDKIRIEILSVDGTAGDACTISEIYLVGVWWRL